MVTGVAAGGTGVAVRPEVKVKVPVFIDKAAIILLNVADTAVPVDTLVVGPGFVVNGTVDDTLGRITGAIGLTVKRHT
jgi:hypothetical protein